MRRAMSRYVPLDMAILGVIEFGLSFMVIQHMLDTPDSAVLLTDGAIRLMLPDSDLAALAALIVGLVALAIGLLQPAEQRNRGRLVAAACLAGLVAFPLFLLITGLFIPGSAAVRGFWLARILGAWLVSIALFRLIFTSLVQQAVLPRRVLIVGDPIRSAAISRKIRSRRGRQFEPLVTTLNAASTGAPLHHGVSWDQLGQQRIWGVVVAPAAHNTLSGHLLDCKLRGMTILSEQAFQERHLGRIDVDALTINDLLFADGFGNGAVAQASKRVGDLLLSIALLLMVLPLMVLTALVIKLDSPGPVFYRQRRTGYLGRPFTLLKFRSMAVDAEPSGAPCWAQEQDPRITRVGSFIRATRIDELPQLANIILGDMSLVGPRPERPHFVEQLALAIPFYRERLYVKPGLTGWAQVNFPYGASVQDAREKLSYDLYYVKHRGVLLDLRILISTVRVVLLRVGAR